MVDAVALQILLFVGGMFVKPRLDFDNMVLLVLVLVVDFLVFSLFQNQTRSKKNKYMKLKKGEKYLIKKWNVVCKL